MGVKFTQKGKLTNASKWLQKSRNNEIKNIFKAYGEVGVTALMEATPKDSGETAYSWEYRIVENAKGVELIFVNNAHPELKVNLAMLIQLGHATGTGGYVPPVDYIRPAILPIYKKAGEELLRRFADL